MCLYITSLLPAHTNLPIAQEVFRKHGRQFRPAEAPKRLRSLLRPGDHYGITTREFCDCGTAVGCRARFPENADDEKELAAQIRRMRRRGRRKGWTAARFDRETQHLREQWDWNKADTAARKCAEAQRWEELLRDLIESAGANGLGLFMHEYNGEFEDERVVLRGQEEITLAKLTPDRILDLRDDVLYRFHA